MTDDHNKSEWVNVYSGTGQNPESCETVVVVVVA